MAEESNEALVGRLTRQRSRPTGSSPNTNHPGAKLITTQRGKRVNLLSAPGFLLVLVVTQIPFLLTIGLSAVSWNVRRPDLPIKFVGTENFGYLLADRDFYTVLWNTVRLTAGSLIIAMFLAFVFALAFNRSFPGVSVARSLLVIPYFVMEPVIGIVWRTLILSPSFGVNAVISNTFGVQPISFFSSENALATITMLCVWQWTPFLFLIFLAGLQSVSEEVLEAAKMDGAGFLRQITSFKIPLMRAYFSVGAMFGMINLLKVFGIIFVTTQGGPGVASANLPYYVYRTGFYDWQIGRSAAISVVMVALVLFVISVVFRAQGDLAKR